MAKKTYQEILKENISNLEEFDTTKTVDVKGPMLDPILGYEGDGELPTYKDAASVLERYYFGERRSEHEISEMDYENDKGESGGKEMKHTEGPEGEEQAGTSNAGDAKGGAKEKEKDIAKEGEELDGEVVSEKEMSKADLKSGNMKDADGPEGEEQAGTGDTYSEFKKRVVESIEEISNQVDLREDDDEEEEEEEDEEKDEKDEGEEKEEMKEGMMKGITKGVKDKNGKNTKGPDGSYHKEPSRVGQTKDERTGAFNEDEELDEVAAPSGVPGGPSPKKKGEDYEDDEGEYSKTNESDEIELDVEEDITEALENEIIEKLIAEMEDEDETLTEQDEEGEEKDEGGKDEGGDEEEDEGLDVDKKMEEMVNRLTSEGEATMKHTEGPEGEEQAGTGGDEKLIPPRKDRSNEGDKSKGTKPMDKAELADA